MEDDRCHVTIVGARRRVDLSVPVYATIAEYTPMLLRACGQETTDDTFPPVWSLALPGARPFPPEATLAESGVVDGATLYLQDAAAGEFDEAEVSDLEEQVDEVNRSGLSWDAGARAHALLLGAVAALVAGFALLVAQRPAQPVGGIGALLAGSGPALLAAHATRRAWSLPVGVRLAMALSAVPLYATAALSVPLAREHLSTALVAAGMGLVLGSAVARLAVPHLLTLAVLTASALFLPTAVGLGLAGADLTLSAGVVAVLLLGLLAVAPTATGHLVALAGGAPGAADREPAGRGPDVTELAWQARRLLTGVAVLCALVLTPALVLLAAADDAWPVALCACVSLALLLRAGLLNALGAVLPQLVAGVTGLASCLALAPASFGAPSWAGPAALVLAALAALGLGLARVFGSPDRVGERPVWMSSLGLFLSVVSVPLALGVFGVFGDLLSLGAGL
ncbi:EsaB/YukD family protein [Streptomyces sp. KL116D]|uniref:EsaB/YukD family protein n=1 Tax=Streptomyces sp. KL116D TaxID=3045152 RepID=UPI00355613B1